MAAVETQQLVVAAAGALGGAFLGAFLATPTEQRVRRGPGRASFLGGSTAGRVTSAVLGMLAVMAGMAAITIGVLRLGDAYPLQAVDRRLLPLALLAGAGLAKWVRYLYWRRRDTA